MVMTVVCRSTDTMDMAMNVKRTTMPRAKQAVTRQRFTIARTRRTLLQPLLLLHTLDCTTTRSAIKTLPPLAPTTMKTQTAATRRVGWLGARKTWDNMMDTSTTTPRSLITINSNNNSSSNRTTTHIAINTNTLRDSDDTIHTNTSIDTLTTTPPVSIARWRKQ